MSALSNAQPNEDEVKEESRIFFIRIDKMQIRRQYVSHD